MLPDGSLEAEEM